MSATRSLKNMKKKTVTAFLVTVSYCPKCGKQMQGTTHGDVGFISCVCNPQRYKAPTIELEAE